VRFLRGSPASAAPTSSSCRPLSISPLDPPPMVMGARLPAPAPARPPPTLHRLARLRTSLLLLHQPRILNMVTIGDRACSVSPIVLPPLSVTTRTAKPFPTPPLNQMNHDHYSSRDDIFDSVADYSLGSSLSKQEHTVINIGDPDGVPRLVSEPRYPEAALRGLLLTLLPPDYLCTIVARL
jgi:hypothetical protein